MSMTFTKLFSSITESTIWTENAPTRIMWITMLAMSDRHGRVWASIPGLANRARVTVQEAEAALSRFLAPDKYSRTPDNEGRRIEIIDGGWRLLNHGKYRAIRDEEAIKESKRKYINTRREAERFNHVENVDRGRHNAEADTEAESTISDSSVPIDTLSGKPDRAPPKKKNGQQHTTTEALEVLQFLNAKTGKNFRGLDGNGKPTAALRAIIDRLKTGVTAQDCKTMIARKHRDWSGDDKMRGYLRPSTLFRASNFENYLGECVAKQEGK